MLQRTWTTLLIGTLLTGVVRADDAFPKFKVEEIEKGLKIGYAVLLVDLNGDQKTDIVVVDKERVVWYENPSWKIRNIIEGQSKPDNVCITSHDVDGDGHLELVLGAGWKGTSTKADGPLYLLKRGKTLDDAWSVFPIGDEPSVHRIRFADLDGDGKPELIVVPLLGKNSTQAKNYMDVPVRILAYQIPKDPVKDRWTPEVLDETLHVIHNFWHVPKREGKGHDLLIASYEGVHSLQRKGEGKSELTKLGEGNQANPKSNRGASEIKAGYLGKKTRYIATIEPWHGHEVVVYAPESETKTELVRRVIDDRLRWGHGVWCADLDGDGDDELIIGVRDNLSDKPGERRGVRLYKSADGKGAKWTRHIIDDGGVAVEDLAAADLNNDGKIDIVAVGRQTFNVRIYWNQGK